LIFLSADQRSFKFFRSFWTARLFAPREPRSRCYPTQ